MNYEYWMLSTIYWSNERVINVLNVLNVLTSDFNSNTIIKIFIERMPTNESLTDSTTIL